MILPRNLPREHMIGNLALQLARLPMDKAWKVEVTEQKARRSHSQNSFLWALYDDILERGGEDMAGWTKDDLHQFFLINSYGSETKQLFGRKRLVPLRRSSRLSKVEFADFVEAIMLFMAERGVVLDSPEQYWEKVA